MIQNQNSPAQHSKNYFRKSLVPLSLVAVIIAAIFTVQSCKKNESSRASEAEIKTAELVGREHNKGLEYVYNALSKSVNNSTDSQTIVRTAQQALIDFANTNQSCVNISNDAKKKRNDFMNRLFSLPADSLSAYNGGILTTSEAETIYKQVCEIGKKASLSDLVPTVNKWNYLKNQAIYIENAEDRFAVLCSIEIAKNSFQYWHDNYNNWIYILSNRSTIKTVEMRVAGNMSVTAGEKEAPSDINYWKVGRADIVTGAGGAKDLAPLGPEGVAAGAIAGAAIGSTIEIINQAFSNKYSWWPF